MRLLVAFVFVVVCQSCFLFQGDGPVEPVTPAEEALPEFLSTPSSFPVQPHIIDEASGIVISRSMPGHLWVIEDGLEVPGVHLLSTSGEYKGDVRLPLFNRDWEDIASGPGPIDGQNYLYIGDIGDNADMHQNYMVYRLKEPSSLTDQNLDLVTISFKYQDRDALDVEAMFVDPKTKDIYFISKRQLFSVRVYRLTYPYSLDTQNVAEFLGTIPHSIITAADMSSDGKQLLIKDYNAVFYWRLKESETIYEALSRTRDVGAPYYVEPQGEAICFDLNDSGYYTFSELNGTSQVNLNYYQRKVVEQ
ncbi:PE-PGRS family protein [Arcticibacterium luteifluviistationis]|uniref:PE-PGRS family protein n=2 Tax=Arcticibacterium luteifluviistationis TaxID=1784714 RepID=A0A2Z4G9C8_9BACT|nr:PE-PGRS family protein [Arcticibacterium luteifluviistationis]